MISKIVIPSGKHKMGSHDPITNGAGGKIIYWGCSLKMLNKQEC